jgi:carbon-monoxide dehydrogenase medium subunit
VKPASFRHHSPRTLDEAVAILGSEKDARVLAGGQSLVPAMALRLARPAHLVDINGIAELGRLSFQTDTLVIGAGVRHAAFHSPVGEGPLAKLLSRVVAHIAHYPIRTRGTFCGSLAHADPASEWCLLAITLGATLVAASARGRRSIPAAQFFAGIMTTALADDEMLVEARLPLLAPGSRYGFHEYSRRPGDYALAMALAVWRLEGGRIAAPRVGIGAAESVPRRLAAVESLLAGAAPSPQLFRKCAEAAAQAIDPLQDLQADAPYRRDLVNAVVRRCLEECAR